MADPRKAVSFSGIGREVVTFLAGGAGAAQITYSATAEGGSAAVGKAVTLSAAGTVALAADGESVIGKLVRVESDGVCAVQVAGFMTLPGGNGAALTLGKAIVGAADAGGAPGCVREVNTGVAAELGRSRGYIVDAGTPAATVVKLP